MSRILVIRFSSLGDIAMTIPVISLLISQNPQIEVIVLTKKGFKDLFGLLGGKVRIIEVDFKKEFNGIGGLIRLFWQLKKIKLDYIADLHAVLRSHFLRILFMSLGVKTEFIRKGRTEKRKLTRKDNKLFRQLSTTSDRYRDVFIKLGFKINSLNSLKLNLKETNSFPEVDYCNKKLIGIAPFAKHHGKIYPIDKIDEVIRLLTTVEGFQVLLFGGGSNEIELLQILQNKYPNVVSVAGKYNLTDEINLMSRLDVILTMDSANMHLAALAGVKVVSIWGATHSYSGFGAWNQPDENKVEINLDCRPCSVYGEKSCYRGDMACMNRIRPEIIVEKIKSCLL